MDTTSTNDGATATIAIDGKSITFTTQTLDTLNEQAVLTYKIQNDSQYNPCQHKIRFHRVFQSISPIRQGILLV